MRPRLNIALIVIACLGLAAALYSSRQLLGGNGRPHLSTPGNSQYYIEQPVTYKFNKQGDLVYKLTARRSLYFQDDTVRIRQPDMHYYASRQGQWHFQAERGFIPPNHNKIRLNDHVNAVNHKTDSGPTRIRTTQAWVYPGKNLVTSSKHVVADNPARRLTGRGMRLNIQTNQLQVQNDTHVIYNR